MPAADRSRSALLTDPEQARDLLQRRLPGFAGALRIDRCAILHTRYRTSPEDVRAGKAFLSVSYRLEVGDATGAAGGVQVLHLKAYPPGRSARKFERARRARSFRPGFGDAVAHLPDLAAGLWSFPNDPKLAHLPEVIDREAVKRHLPYPFLPAGFDSPARIREVRVEVVRYKPEVRCTTRYELRAVSRAAPLVIYGKTFGHGRAAEVSRRMHSLWGQSAGDGQALRLGRPLGYSEGVKTVWQEGLPGAPLTGVIDRHDYPDLLARAAAGLARFHRAHVGGLPSNALRDDLQAVRAEVAEMAQAFPRRAAHLGAVVSALDRDLPSLETQPPRLVHGDFLLKQLVVHEGQLGLCDFDNLSLGDPVRDLANFVVDLHFQRFGSSLARDMAGTFLAAYAAEAGGAVPSRRWQWQRRLHVLRSAYYVYKRRHGAARFEEELAGILALADGRRLHA